MKREKYYWKVVTKQSKDSKMSSCSVICGNHCITYEINKISQSTLPNGIFCFKTRKHARLFKSRMDNQKYHNKFRVLKVKAIGEEIPRENIILYSVLWLNGNELVEMDKNLIPIGTINFPAVIPIEID